jgi:hypothetical protein
MSLTSWKPIPNDATQVYAAVAEVLTDSATGEITVADSLQLDYETTTSFTLDVQAADGDGGTGTATVTINLLNQASITGTVFVDVNQNALDDANEPGVDGVLVELLDKLGEDKRRPVIGAS